jgi:formylglycine-generating enzyme required for sulfatase activity
MPEVRILGDYHLIKQIGQGSLGTVFLAEHRFMKKQYVLKVLPEELASDRAFVQRFEEEVSQLAALEHPHIVKIHNVSYAQGQYFLVIDCVVDELGETTNLSQYMMSRTKRLEEKMLMRLLMQIAEALDFAHKKSTAKGIVHRNLKPNNILVAKGKSGIDLFISDFGLSRIIGSAAVLTRTYKAVAEAIGLAPVLYNGKAGQDRYPNPAIETQKQTPLHVSFLQNLAFLAPEQRRMDHPYTADCKADSYAFGVLVYYMLMGEFPEILFNMPSEQLFEYEWDWDPLFLQCLQSDPNKRPELLVPLLESIPKSSKQRALATKAISKSHLEGIQLNIPITYKTEKAFEENTANLNELEMAGATIAHTFLEEVPNGSALRPIIRSTQFQRPRADLDPATALQVDTSVKHYIPERREVKHIQPLQTEMAVIAGGKFFRGSKDGNRDEVPRHQITLSSFAIDIHPVTNEQFVRFLEVMEGEKDSNHLDIIRLRDSRVKRSGGKLSIESGYTKHPVVGVTWYGAVAYAMWVGKRLPTEAEWEIAAAGGVEMLYPTGDDIEKTQANFFSSDTTAVMSYAANPYSIYDMAGNVYEWCHDWYGYNYYEVSIQEPDNPKGPLQGVYRVLRGGCWKSLKEDLRCSRRHRNNPGTVNGTYGFRCAADVQ